MPEQSSLCLVHQAANENGRLRSRTVQFNFVLCHTLSIFQAKSLDANLDELDLALRLLSRRIRTTGASFEISLSQRSVIAKLWNDGPATISELARAERVKPQSMGTAVAELEERGLVAREPHPTDGRQQNIVLTDKGRSLREQMRSAKRDWLAQSLAQLDEADQKLLFAASSVLKRLGEH